MNQILCSSGAFLGKENNNDYTLLKEYAKRLNCDGIELMIGRSWYPKMDDMIETVRSYKLNIPTVHANKALGEYLCGMTATYENGQFSYYIMTEAEEQELFEKGTELFCMNLKAAKELGAAKMVLHLWNGIPSDARIDNNLRRFGEWKALSDAAGIDLLVENVICNQKDPLYNMNLVAAAYEDVGFVYDTKMAEFHDQTMKLFEEPNISLVRDGKIRHLHINDYGGGVKDWGNMKILPIGSGHVDFDTFFKKFFAYGYNGDFTVESTATDKEGNVDFDMLNGCFDRIREYLKNSEAEL